jgi:hypothetical protein
VSKQAFRLLVFALLLAVSGVARAADAVVPTATDADKSYLALRNSKDTKTQLLAERWYGLVKLREWSDATGQFKTDAKYVEQDEKQGTVKLRVIKGFGHDQIVKDKTIAVDKLSKECQARVKQIAFLTTKVDDAAKAEAEKAAKPKDGQDAMAGTTAGMMGEQPGAERDPRATRGAKGRAKATSDMADHPRDEAPADARGVQTAPPAESAAPLPAAMAPLPVVDAAPPPATPADSSAAANDPRARPRPVRPANLPDQQPWRTSFDAFRANVVPARTDNGWQISWGELTALQQAHDQAVPPTQYARGGEPPPAPSLDSLGEVAWEVALSEQPDVQTDWSKALGLTLPEPCRIICELDNERGPGEWRRFFPGDRVKIIGRFTGFEGDGGIHLAIRFPDEVSVPAPPRPVRER